MSEREKELGTANNSNEDRLVLALITKSAGLILPNTFSFTILKSQDLSSRLRQH